MNAQSSHRIDYIKRGEVPDGFKKANGEIVPVEWTLYQMGTLYTERKEAGDPTLPILSVSIHSGVSDGELNEDELGKKVKRIADKTQYKTAHAGDLVFNMMRAWQGGIGVAKTDGLISPAYIVAAPNEKVYPPFMDSYIKTSRMVNTIHRQSYGITDFRLRLYWDSFAPIGCVLPGIAEQQKIADILTTQDKIVELKEKRLAEKRRQKKYLMQHLLTGKKRLPGFVGEWETSQFGNILSFMQTNTCSRNDMNSNSGEVQNIHYGDVLIKFKETIDCNKVSLPYLNDNCFSSSMTYIESGDVIIADTAEDNMVGKAVELRNVSQKVVSGLHTMLCRPQKDVFSSGWLGYFINSGAYHKQLLPLITGIKVSGLSKRSIMNTMILIPSLIEQAEILKILFTADREIELLQADINIEAQKKRALIQLLLTGIVRVKV